MLIPLLLAAAAPTSVAALQDRRRVLIVSAASADDPALAAQRATLQTWQREAAERDISVVEVIGGATRGASDTAPTLRAKYQLPAKTFGVVLVGKDGHVAMRSAKPIAADTLAGTIDAMPMRRAGQR